MRGRQMLSTMSGSRRTGAGASSSRSEKSRDGGDGIAIRTRRRAPAGTRSLHSGSGRRPTVGRIVARQARRPSGQPTYTRTAALWRGRLERRTTAPSSSAVRGPLR
jgi:hypothetical protein